MRRRIAQLLVLVVVVLLAGFVARRLLAPEEGRSAPSASTSQNGNGAIEVTVRQGTSMAIALSPDKSRVAIDLQGGLWIVPIAGGAATRITDEYGDARQPAWSPDGASIAFQSYRDGMWRIWTVAADGSNLAPLTDGPFDDREPHWSPDGSTIAFSSDRSGNYDIWLLTVATREVRQLTANPANDYFPSWSPDGTQIAFVSTRESAPGVYAIDLDGRERLVTASGGTLGAPSWSPDGTVLFSAIPTANALARRSLGEGAAPDDQSKLVLGDRTIATGEDYFPFRAQWVSADELLYPADGLIKRRSLTSGPVGPVAFEATLTVAPATYTRKPRDFDSTTPNRALGVIRPVMSPDGRQLAFAALGDLWTMPIDGKPERLTDDRFVDTDAAWSTDGTRMAFSSDRAGGMDIWVSDLRTGTDRRLTSMPDAEMAAAWSPDDRWIAFVSNQAYEQGELYVVSAEGGKPRKVHERIFGAGYPSWTGGGRAIVTPALRPYSTRFRESMNYYRVVPVDGNPETPGSRQPATGSQAPVRAEVIVPTTHMPMGKRSGDGPAVSPDGRHLAFVSHGFLYVMPIGPDAKPTGPARQLTSELTDTISWAGADRVLYVATDHVKVVSLADGTTRDVPIDLTWQRKIPAGRLVVHAGRLVDGVQPTTRTNVDLMIERNRIVAIEAHDDRHHTGTVIDASDRSVMPGLIEGHGHNLKEHGDLFGRVHLAYGVTGFRNVGGQPYDSIEDKEAIASGRRVGPRVFTTGYLLDGSRPYYPMASTAPTEAVVDMELARAQALDYDMFKTYVRLPDLLQKRAVEGAHRIGIPASSHEIYPSALSGMDSVEHTGATSRRGYSTKQSGMGRAYEDVIAIVSKAGMTLTPTLGLGGFRAAVAADPTILDDPRWIALQPAWTKAALAATARAGRSVARPRPTEAEKTVLALHKAGATIIAGVDSPLTPYATALHYELQDYVTAGLTPFEALRTATINIATLMGAAKDLGTLEVGKLADMVIVDGNPLENIADTLRVQMVIKNGEAFTVDQLVTPSR